MKKLIKLEKNDLRKIVIENEQDVSESLKQNEI